VPFGAGVVVPALFGAESAELAVVLLRVPVALFCALVAVVLADPVVVRLAAVVRGAVRAGVLFAAGAVLSAAFAGRAGAVLSAAFAAAVTAGALGSLSVTASCHALRLGTSGELSR
jgi:hypothetical protein